MVALDMTDTTSQRLLPLRCFQCGMPINNKQAKYDALLLEGAEPREALAALQVVRMCCKVVLGHTAVDSRLRRRFKETTGFVTLHKMARLDKVYTLASDGSTEPVAEGEAALVALAAAVAAAKPV